MREVAVKWAGGPFAQDVAVGGHHLRADEEIAKGGEDTGAAPHELLLAALGACTAMTLKIYAERKGWPVRDVRVTLAGNTTDTGLVISRQVAIDGDLDDEQRRRMFEIADKCPVHKSLSNPITIKTSDGAA
jgi:putative redox protein